MDASIAPLKKELPGPLARQRTVSAWPTLAASMPRFSKVGIAHIFSACSQRRRGVMWRVGVCVRVRVCVWTCVCACVRVYACVFMRVYACLCVLVRACVRACVRSGQRTLSLQAVTMTESLPEASVVTRIAVMPEGWFCALVTPCS